MRSNLPPGSQAWGNDIEAKIRELEAENKRLLNATGISASDSRRLTQSQALQSLGLPVVDSFNERLFVRFYAGVTNQPLFYRKELDWGTRANAALITINAVFTVPCNPVSGIQPEDVEPVGFDLGIMRANESIVEKQSFSTSLNKGFFAGRKVFYGCGSWSFVEHYSEESVGSFAYVMLRRPNNLLEEQALAVTASPNAALGGSGSVQTSIMYL